MISLTSTTPIDREAVLEELCSRPAIDWLPRVVSTLLPLIVEMAGAESEETGQQHRIKIERSNSSAITFEQHFTTLFEVATGVLGWTPETAWNATPAEIIAANKGRIDLLKSIFGNSANTSKEFDPLDTAFDREGLAALKAMGAAH